METLIEKLNTDRFTAKKSGDKLRATLLTTLYSEACNIGLNDGKRQTTDEEVIAVIKKFIKNIDECLLNCVEEQKLQYNTEKDILTEYLPKQLSDDDLAIIINQLIDLHHGQKSQVMRALKDMCGGKYNGKTASDLFDSMV